MTTRGRKPPAPHQGHVPRTGTAHLHDAEDEAVQSLDFIWQFL